MASRKKVVIVGGGVAGANLAKALEKKNIFDVTLVDTKDYVEIVFAAPRSIVQGREFGRKTLFKHSDYLKATSIVVAACVSVSATSISLDNGQTLDFDFLCLCTGSTYATFKAREDAEHDMETRLSYYDSEAEKFKATTSIAVCGGGPVGVELVGELAEAYPEKKITLITSADRLLPQLSQKSSTVALGIVKKSPNVTVILNDKLVASDGPGPRTTEKGATVDADLVVAAYGCKPNTGFLDPAWLDANHRVKVDMDLRVSGTTNVFCAGDATSVDEEKMAITAQAQTQVVVSNLVALSQNPKAKTKAYTPGRKMMVVSYGSTKGVGELPFLGTITRILPPYKARTLFVGYTRTTLGAPAAE